AVEQRGDDRQENPTEPPTRMSVSAHGALLLNHSRAPGGADVVSNARVVGISFSFDVGVETRSTSADRRRALHRSAARLTAPRSTGRRTPAGDRPPRCA